MKISELIEKLKEIEKTQGNCEVVIDNDSFTSFMYIKNVEGKFYQHNTRFGTSSGDYVHTNRAFIVVDEG